MPVKKPKNHKKSTKPSVPNPLKLDPTQTTTLRRKFTQEIGKGFAAVARSIQQLITVEDAFGLKPTTTLAQMMKSAKVANVFCPNGPGGGVDPTCSPKATKKAKGTADLLRFMREDRAGNWDETDRSNIKKRLSEHTDAERKYIASQIGVPHGTAEEMARIIAPSKMDKASWISGSTAHEDAKRNNSSDSPRPRTKATAEQISEVKASIVQEISRFPANVQFNVWELRNTIRAPDADAFDRAVKELRREKQLRLIAVGDLSDLSKRQLMDSIPGENEIFAYFMRVAPVTNKRWQFSTSPEKINAFQVWLKSKLDSEIRGKTQEDLWKAYVLAGMKKGAGRAFDDAKKKDQIKAELEKKLPIHQVVRDEFLRTAFLQPVAVEKVQLIAERAFDELENMTADMANKLTRALADGLVQGKSPLALARDIVDQVGIAKERAELIARTECLPGDTLVDGAVVRAIFRRRYDGPMVEVITRNGRKFSATPNHPMLTRRGWVAAGFLQNGDDLICRRRCDDLCSSGKENVHGGPATLSEIFDSLSAVCVAERDLCGQPDFHGDGMDGEVDVLCPDRELRIGAFSSIHEELVESVFAKSDQGSFRFCAFCGRLLSVNKQPCLCRAAQLNAINIETVLDDAPINTQRTCDAANGFPIGVATDDSVGVNVVPELVRDTAKFPGMKLALGNRTANTLLSEDLANLLLLGPDEFGDLPLREAREIEIDDVLSVTIRPFSGHVYNLETPFGYYTVDQLYTGNTIRAHAEGQLLAMEQMGIDEVGVMVEWQTTPDHRLCKKCASMAGVVLRVEEAHGMIPRHPRCRCAWVPANVGESHIGQKRSKTAIIKAIAQSGKEDGWREAIKISKDRPESPVGNERRRRPRRLPNYLVEFSRLLHEPSDGPWEAIGAAVVNQDVFRAEPPMNLPVMPAPPPFTVPAEVAAFSRAASEPSWSSVSKATVNGDRFRTDPKTDQVPQVESQPPTVPAEVAAFAKLPKPKPEWQPFADARQPEEPKRPAMADERGSVSLTQPSPPERKPTELEQAREEDAKAALRQLSTWSSKHDNHAGEQGRER